MAELVAPEVVVQIAGIPELLRGRAAFQEWAESYLSGWKSELTIDHVIAEKDSVAIRWTMRGTHTGDYAGLPATGADVSFTAMEWIRFEDGMAVQCWILFDTADLFQQLGILPKGGPPRALVWLLTRLRRLRRHRIGPKRST
jgi:steroid delta-isomerase-like uncharacterized protein